MRYITNEIQKMINGQETMIKSMWKIRTMDGYEILKRDMCLTGLWIGTSFYPPEMIQWRRKVMG